MKAALLQGINSKYLAGFLPDLEIVSLDQNPEVIFIRSEKLSPLNIPQSVFAICRAGAGTDNIPVGYCNEKGIVVFNTPGANANSVKELVISLMIAAARNIPNILEYMDRRRRWDRKAIEERREQFRGNEIRGKTLGVIGVGAIGSLVAQAAADLGMDVVGYDKYAPDKNFYGIRRAETLKSLSECDFISIHCSLTDETRNFINDEVISFFKRGVILLNFARAELIDQKALKEALKTGRVAKYVSDFHDPDLRSNFPEKVTTLNHVGALTEEAEQNAQERAAKQFSLFWKEGIIENSVNFDSCRPDPRGDNYRFVVINRNIPGMEHKIKGVLAEARYNICYSLDKSPKGNPLGYNIIDVENADARAGEIARKISEIDGVKRVRVIH